MRLEIPHLSSTSRVAFWLFLRGLALVYLAAFASLAPQIEGLVGSSGILPAGEFLHILGDEMGVRSFFAVPSLFWLHVGDGTLRWATGAGVVLSLLLFLDVAPALTAALLWFLYLSVVSVGQDFFAFQWDGLLLEAGLLAALAAPWRLGPRLATLTEPPAFGLFLLRFLLFRLMFLSGAVKLASGDAAWRDLSALSWHWYTQPLPTPLAWHAAQLPAGFQQFSCAVVLVVELAFPFLIFGGKIARRVAFAAFALLELGIAATGNFAFFNALTLVLAVLLLDDGAFHHRVSNALDTALERSYRVARGLRARRWALFGLGGFLLFWSLIAAASEFPQARAVPAWLNKASFYVGAWRSVNGYGLFAVMTKTRGEISIEGSDDGEAWKPYAFRYKPNPEPNPANPFAGKPGIGWVAPYQPRLDWQMWFAALSSGEKTPWFENLAVRLLQGSEPVSRLFAENPFPRHPPRFIRAMYYDCRYTTPAERKTAVPGTAEAWWHCQPSGWYYPAISLSADGAPAPAPAPATAPAGN